MYSLAANISCISYEDGFKPRALIFAYAQVDSYFVQLANSSAQYTEATGAIITGIIAATIIGSCDFPNESE